MSKGSASASPIIQIEPSVHQQLQELLESAARSNVAWLDTALARLVRRPGKRIRPALLLTAAACNRHIDTSAALACAAAVELLHQSSLIHDDLMDAAPSRGDQVALHVSNGQAAALLGGDYLLAAGGRLISQVGGDAAAVWHEAYRNMCEGQARETANLYRLTTIEEYLLTVRGKTAALIRAACHLGYLCGQGDPALTALADFGESFGMMFQILDDLMDALSTPTLLGKPVQHDIPRGVYTLPVLTATQADTSPLAHILAPDLPDTRVAAAYTIIRTLAAAPTITAIYRWADRAQDSLAALPPSAARDTLARLPRQYAHAVLTERVAEPYRHLVAPMLRTPTD